MKYTEYIKNNIPRSTTYNYFKQGSDFFEFGLHGETQISSRG